jgi:hypothetical protein
MSARPFPLMTPAPTGYPHNVDSEQLREEFRHQVDATTIDAPEWMPTGGVYSWVARRGGRLYMQPHGEVR